MFDHAIEFPERGMPTTQEEKIQGYKNMRSELLDMLKERDEKLHHAIQLIRMVADHRLMPHQHSDPQTKLYCLTERANEFLQKYGVENGN